VLGSLASLVAVLRNDPVIGHLRFLLEYIQPEVRPFGALSANAIMALNQDAWLGNFAHDTGEGLISPLRQFGPRSKQHKAGAGDRPTRRARRVRHDPVEPRRVAPVRGRCGRGE
jgi:hypothetical protein